MPQEILDTVNEIIKKQAVILGPEIAVLKAREVEGLVFSGDDVVTDIKGDLHDVLQEVVDKYVSLSGQIVKKAMEPLLKRHISDTPSVDSSTVREGGESVSSLLEES